MADVYPLNYFDFDQVRLRELQEAQDPVVHLYSCLEASEKKLEALAADENANDEVAYAMILKVVTFFRERVYRSFSSYFDQGDSMRALVNILAAPQEGAAVPFGEVSLQTVFQNFVKLVREFAVNFSGPAELDDESLAKRLNEYVGEKVFQLNGDLESDHVALSVQVLKLRLVREVISMLEQDGFLSRNTDVKESLFSFADYFEEQVQSLQ